jgi:hypothetical protein
MFHSDHSTTYKFRCRPNLIGALRCLRRPDQCRTIWIDAICINKADEDEKDIQVHRIASIHKHAYRVVVLDRA